MNLEGSVESILFENPEAGYVVFRMRAKGRPEPLVATGVIPALTVGEEVFLSGVWRNHPQYGLQFEVSKYRQVLPATVSGIKKFLGSGTIRGIGKGMADRLVTAFGEATLDVIEQSPERLREVEGIGPFRMGRILDAWKEQRAVREVMLFLHECGLNISLAARIFKRFRQAAPSIIRENPYQLSLDIAGIGFKTADKIAAKIGIPQDSLERAEAGVVHRLWEATSDGHVYLPEEMLLTETAEFLGVPQERVAEAVTSLIGKKYILRDSLAGGGRIYVTPLAHAEAGVARELNRLLTHPRSLREFNRDKAVDWGQEQLGLTLAEKQREAVHAALENKVMILTGGPGTGKTTITRCIMEIFSALKVKLMLAAPTGRAARRLSETCRREALTIHRLLKSERGKGGFSYNRENRLKVDVLIVDESSMIDTPLMYSLLQALPNHTSVVFVGDVNQLPSVGPGTVLEDMIRSAAIPVVRLDQVFRQAKRSLIVENAHRINQGEFPISPSSDDKWSDFYFIRKEDPEKIVETILEMARTRIPERFHIEVRNVQVLTPMNRGVLGTANLNERLQTVMNPDGIEIPRNWQRFRVGDRVMQTRNNYDKEVSNGDIGLIQAYNLEEQVVTVDFDGVIVPYDLVDLEELTLAYAVSIHKSQGSEFPAVIIPIVTQHFMMLRRNLVYTAVTRARKLAVLIGTAKALALALKRVDTGARFTGLTDRLTSKDWDRFLDGSPIQQTIQLL